MNTRLGVATCLRYRRGYQEVNCEHIAVKVSRRVTVIRLQSHGRAQGHGRGCNRHKIDTSSVPPVQELGMSMNQIIFH
jgi:hypothetical protein